MAMGTERSKQLHNFTMPDLRWGNQRFLRCMKIESDEGIPPPRRLKVDNRGSSDRQRDQRRRTARDWDWDRELLFSEFMNGSESPVVSPNTEVEDGVAAMREKVMLDLQTAADKMKKAILTQSSIAISPPPPPPSVDAEAHRPWNLRTRRGHTHKSPPSSSVAKLDAPPQPQMGSSSTAAADSNQRSKFTIPITKRQIEEDFFSMTGHRPPRRPKREHESFRNRFVPRAVANGNHRRQVQSSGNSSVNLSPSLDSNT